MFIYSKFVFFPSIFEFSFQKADYHHEPWRCTYVLLNVFSLRFFTLFTHPFHQCFTFPSPKNALLLVKAYMHILSPPNKRLRTQWIIEKRNSSYTRYIEHQIHRHHNALSKQIDSVYLHWHWLYGHWVVFHLQWMLLVRVCVLSRLFVNSWDFPYFS